jgi:hypothetical protein
MNVEHVYKKLDLPQNLTQHMLTVAYLVGLARGSWQDDTAVDWDRLTVAALLHDIGNIVKFDLKNYPELLGAEVGRLEYWQSKQAELIARYGSDDHEATDQMLNELGVDDATRRLIASKSFGNVIELSKQAQAESKLLLYCDLRVMPGKIASLGDRLEEVRIRLKKYGDRPDFEQMVQAAYEIEEWVTARSSLQHDIDAVTMGEIPFRELLSKEYLTDETKH